MSYGRFAQDQKSCRDTHTHTHTHTHLWTFCTGPKVLQGHTHTHTHPLWTEEGLYWGGVESPVFSISLLCPCLFYSSSRAPEGSQGRGDINKVPWILVISPFLPWVHGECMRVELCPTLCNPMDCSPLGSSARGIFQASILEREAIPFSRGSSWLRDWTRVFWVSCIGR